MTEREVITNFDAATGPWERGVSRIEKRLARFERGTDKKLSSIDRRLDSVGAGFARMGRSAGAATRAIKGHVIAVAAATAGFTALVVKSFEFAESIQDQANKTGVAVEALQELQFAADQNGASARDMTDALTRLQRRIGLFVVNGAGPAKAGIEALGLEQDILSGKLAGTEQIFLEVTRRLGELGDQAKVSAVASAFFGDDAGPRLAALLSQGSSGLQRFRDEARRLGLVMSSDLVGRAADTNARFRALGTTLGRQVMSAVVQLEPELRAIVNLLIDSLPAIASFTQNVLKAIKTIGSVAGTTYDAMALVGGPFAPQGAVDAATRLRARGQSEETNRAEIEVLKSRIAAREAEAKVYEEAGRDATNLRSLIENMKSQRRVLEQFLGPEFEFNIPPRPAPKPPAPAPAGAGGGGAGGSSEHIDMLSEARRVIEETASAEERLAEQQRRLSELAPYLVQVIQAEALARGETITAAQAEEEAKARIEIANARLVASSGELERAQEESLKQFSKGLLNTVRNANSLEDALSQISDRLLDMAADGVFDALFGGQRAVAGGGIGGIASGAANILSSLLGFSSGGHVRGPGTGTSDSILARLSDGEYVMNARATRRALPLLEALNRGRLPAFAEGGLVGSPVMVAPVTPRFSAGSGGISVSAPVTVNLHGSRGGDDSETGRIVGAAAKRAVTEGIQQQLRPGGLIDAAMRRNRGL